MAEFNGRLNPNEIFGALYNMIISQRVFADNIKGTYATLVDKARVDGSMYGDQKLYYSTDVLRSHPWGADAEAQNLLALDRPQAPKVQAIVLNVFRQIRLTVDNYLSKRAWSTEGAFSSFNSIMIGWMRDTKRVYDSLTYNCYIGTAETDFGYQTMDITPIQGQNDALTMAEALATLLVNLRDVTRAYNDYGHMRSYNESDLIVIWNAKHYNTLKYVDLPTIFHNEGLLNEFEQHVLPERYFGTVNAGTKVGLADKSVRSLIEQDIQDVHYFPGDPIEEGVTAPDGTSYKVDDTIAFKVMHRDSVPYMSSFEVGTSFFNPRSLSENRYLTYGHNTLEYLKNYPFITARFNEA